MHRAGGFPLLGGITKKMIKSLLLKQSAKTSAEAEDQLHQRHAKTLPTSKQTSERDAYSRDERDGNRVADAQKDEALGSRHSAAEPWILMKRQSHLLVCSCVL